MFKTLSINTLSKYDAELRQINLIGQELKKLTDAELKSRAVELKKRVSRNKMAQESPIVNEAFALVREASERVIGLRHFDVQIIGGLVLNEGKIAEMKTGEGKTIVSLLPTFLNALYSKGVHVVTVNDYLARRDSEYVGKVHQFLGLTVGLIQEDMSPEERKENYNCDVVYVTNNELGFDYLRDNMAATEDELVQGPFYYCVIDEVDSILIDEARTPLIISGPSQAPTEKYLRTAKLATTLKRDVHYLVDEKTQNATLTNEGTEFCEQALGLGDMYNVNEPWISYVLNSIKAKEIYTKNKNYIINEDQEIVIVDEFTGRTMVGRRWSDGLHQAVEAKENVPIQNESQTLASISYQNLFLLYEKLSGMTGTAKTEEVEFEKIYNLNVVPIPTNKPVKRKDFSDLIYRNQYMKWKAVAQECLEMSTIGRPVLVGTTTIEKSELLGALLTEYNVPYRLLNARPENVEMESEIVAQAGCKNAVTIATNMAGRGTDIMLGGNPQFLTNSNLDEFFIQNQVSVLGEIFDKTIENEKLKSDIKENYQIFFKNSVDNLDDAKDSSEKAFNDFYKVVMDQNKETAKGDGEEIRRFGGLHVIGTERHESRRIDNQLRGRAGRQGDPGSSRFFLSLEDKLLRIFGGEQILKVMQTIGIQDDTPIQSSLLDSSLESAQKKVEAYYFDTRKQLFEYDEALNRQRNGVYKERKRILQQKNLRPWIIDYAERTIYDLFLNLKSVETVETNKQILVKLEELLRVPIAIDLPISESSFDYYLNFLNQQIQICYDLKEVELESIEEGLIRELERSFIIQQIDVSWKEHLQKISFLRDSIRWRAYGQKNPLTEYKKEAFNAFTIMLAVIRQRVVYLMLRSKTIIF